MSLFNGPVAQFVRENRLIRRGALIACAAVGFYFIGVSSGWWSSLLG